MGNGKGYAGGSAQDDPLRGDEFHDSGGQQQVAQRKGSHKAHDLLVHRATSVFC